jgi:hypothetical protein
LPRIPAAETVLATAAAGDLLREFNERWRRETNAAVEIR